MYNLIKERIRDRGGADAGARLRPNRTIFFLLIFIPCFTTLIYGGTESWALIFIGPLIALLAAVWLIRSIRTGEFTVEADPLLLPLAGIFALGLFQLLPFGGDTLANDLLGVQASRSFSMDPFATRIFLTRLTGYIIFFAAALTFIDTEVRRRKLVAAISIIGGTLAFGGILQKLASPAAIYGLRETPNAIPFGPFVNQHHFASLMVLLSGPTLGQIFAKVHKRQTKLLHVISSVLMAAAVVLTGSRGGLIAFCATFGITLLAFFGRRTRDKEREKWMPVAIAAISGAVIVIGLVIFLGGAESLLRGVGFQNTTDDISSGRLHFWSVAWQIFLSNPIIGVGFDAFGVAFTAFDTRNGLFRVEQAHNDYLQTLADGGVVGFLCVAAFVSLFAKRCLLGIKTLSDRSHRAVVLGAFAGCFGMLIHSFFDFPLRTAANAFFFLLVAALAITCISRNNKQNTLTNAD